LPAPGKGVIRNDRLLDLMGVSRSEASSSAGCSAYSLDDERPAAVAPLKIVSPHLNRPQQELYSSCLEPGPLSIEEWTNAEEELPSETHFLEEDSPPQQVVLRKTRLSKTSEELLRRSATFEPDFQTRMKQFLTKNQQKKERIRQALAVEEEPAIVPMPRINQVQALTMLCRLSCFNANFLRAMIDVNRDRRAYRATFHTCLRGTTRRKASLRACVMPRLLGKTRLV